MIGRKAHVHVATINPKCVDLRELHGEYNPSTVEWKDGLLSLIFRKFSRESNAGTFTENVAAGKASICLETF